MVMLGRSHSPSVTAVTRTESFQKILGKSNVFELVDKKVGARAPEGTCAPAPQGTSAPEGNSSRLQMHSMCIAHIPGNGGGGA